MQVRRFILLCGVLGTIDYGLGCQLSEFMCDTGYCVALDKFCNGNDDCGDKSDEPPYCSRKSFPRLYIYYDNDNNNDNILCALWSRETINETYFRLGWSQNAPLLRPRSHTHNNISIKLKLISLSHVRHTRFVAR